MTSKEGGAEKFPISFRPPPLLSFSLAARKKTTLTSIMMIAVHERLVPIESRTIFMRARGECSSFLFARVDMFDYSRRHEYIYVCINPPNKKKLELRSEPDPL